MACVKTYAWTCGIDMCAEKCVQPCADMCRTGECTCARKYVDMRHKEICGHAPPARRWLPPSPSCK